MKPVRALTRLLTPVRGEAFASYIDRLADLHKLTRAVMLEWLGFFEEGRYYYIRGFGVVLDNAMLERFSTATQLPQHIVKEMQLASYKGLALDLSKIDLNSSDTLRVLPVYEWVYFSGSHACPHCLREKHGAWQLAWKFPWTFACVKHKCYLISNCPACGLRLALGERALAAPSRSWLKHKPLAGYCNNSHHVTTDGSISLCNCDLTNVPTRHASNSTLKVQNLLNEYLSGKDARAFDSYVSPLEYFRDLRALCQFMLFCAELEDFDYLPPFEKSAFSKFADERKNLAAAISDYGRRETSPESPELMAALTRLATSILASDAATMAVSLKPLTDRFCAKLRHRWIGFRAYEFSERLASVVSRNMGTTGIFDYTVGFKSAETREALISFGPQHVPPLLWLDDYNRSFAAFFPHMKPTIARRFCSMALVKLCGEYSWAQSARQLKLTEDSEFTSGCGLEALRQTGALRDFAKALREVAQRLSSDPNKIDYASRRAALSSFIEIPYEVWAAMCREVGINPGRIGSRNKYVAIWVWAALTGSEWKFAPGLVGERKIGSRKMISFTGSKHRVFLAYCKTFIPTVAPLLLAYGSQILQQNSVR
jgi:hypothetical protein